MNPLFTHFWTTSSCTTLRDRIIQQEKRCKVADVCLMGYTDTGEEITPYMEAAKLDEINNEYTQRQCSTILLQFRKYINR
jgi:hypothetical protein